MTNRIISKNDLKALNAAAKVLKRLECENNIRHKKLRMLCNGSSTYQEYWNAKRKYYYFLDVCHKAGVGVEYFCGSEHAVLMSNS